MPRARVESVAPVFLSRADKFVIDVQTALPQIWTTNMAVTFALGLRAFCVATGLFLATARGAEPVSPLIGATRDQLLSRYGEPKSQIAAGTRVIYFYARERVVLRDNVVVEVEPIGEVRRAPEPADPLPAPGTAAQGTTTPANPSTDAPSANRQSPATPPTSRPAQPAAPAPASSDSRVEIKLVRPPSAIDSRPAAPEAPPVLPTTPPPVAPMTAPVETKTPITAQPTPASPKNSTDTKSAPGPAATKAVEPAKTAREDVQKAAVPAATPPPKAERSPTAEPDGSFGTQIYVIGLAVFVGGALLLYWRHRQRQLVLAATSVSNTPLPVSLSRSPFVSNAFTLDELNKLDAKKFEELVAAYYSKTGVVAERTKTGPESPVHIKIAWKGEPRPFAYVQCLAQPGATIDPKPLQALVAVLEKDNIRRGYIVTSGKFNAIARDFAEQKHLTLLPSDIFLEKLNALPSAARTEIMQSIANGGKAPA